MVYQGGKYNSLFRQDRWSQHHILDFKDDKNKYNSQVKAIMANAKILNSIIGNNIVIAVVPSSTADKFSSLHKLAARLKNLNPSVIDGSKYLVRHNTIPKAAKSGPRDVNVHLKSLKMLDKEFFQGKTVLLLDDVVTTGCSLQACYQLLKGAGASFVCCLAFGRTYSEYDSKRFFCGAQKKLYEYLFSNSQKIPSGETLKVNHELYRKEQEKVSQQILQFNNLFSNNDVCDFSDSTKTISQSI